MKKAIVSLAIGNPEPYRVGLHSSFEYSKRIGADYYVITEPLINYRFPHFEKLQVLGLFDQGYDRVLYLDGDIIVTPDSKDIFEQYPDENKFYAYDENTNPDLDCMDRDPDVEAIPKDFEWLKNGLGKYRYFNSGVMLFSKRHRSCFSGVENLPNVPVMWKYAEQTSLNYLISKNKIEWETIDYSFNRMDLGQEDPKKERFKANIIHYAGPCRYVEQGQKTKYHQMVKDWDFLKNGKS
jgi:lipopolysaccharide biosynthesis glycosyltransferase